MTGWLASLIGLPTRLQEFGAGQTHENGVQRAGLQPCIAADVVPISPFFGRLEKGVEHLDRLSGQSKAFTHVQKVYIYRLVMSTRDVVDVKFLRCTDQKTYVRA
jgi:hypothetical protein